jgi:hypothetical protein
MHSWDNTKGREGDTSLSLPGKKSCPCRIWFGDYALAYCDVDNDICEEKTECRYDEKDCATLLQKIKDE